MRAFAFFALCLTWLVPAMAEHPKEYYDPDVQRLMAVEGFAFGPTGPTAAPCAGERAFAAIIRKPAAIRCMLQVFDHGTAEAKCYALIALREYSVDLYRQCVGAMRLDQTPVVALIDGERVRPVPMTKMLDDIGHGMYRKYFRQYEDETP